MAFANEVWKRAWLFPNVYNRIRAVVSVADMCRVVAAALPNTAAVVYDRNLYKA